MKQEKTRHMRQFHKLAFAKCTRYDGNVQLEFRVACCMASAPFVVAATPRRPPSGDTHDHGIGGVQHASIGDGPDGTINGSNQHDAASMQPAVAGNDHRCQPIATALAPSDIEAGGRTDVHQHPDSTPRSFAAHLRTAQLAITSAAACAIAALLATYAPPTRELTCGGFETPEEYVRKFRAPICRGRPSNLAFACWSSMAIFVALLLLGLIDAFATSQHGWHVLLAFNGATAVLLFCTPEAVASQPSNMLVGQQLAAVTAIVVTKIFGEAVVWLQGPLAVAITALLMHLTGCVNPPGGALALFYVTSPATRANGWLIMLSALIGAALQVAVAILLLNVVRARRYPQHYW